MCRPITWQFILSMSIAASCCRAWQHSLPTHRHHKPVSKNRIKCMKCKSSSFDNDGARFAIASTSIVVASTLLVFRSSVKEATAMDIPSSFIVQQKREVKSDAPIYHNSIDIAYQRLFNRDSKVLRYQTLLSSSDSSISKVTPSISSPTKKGSELKATDIETITKENKIRLAMYKRLLNIIILHCLSLQPTDL